MAIETRFGGGATRAGHKPPPQYELAEFARRYGLSAVKAKEILDRAGDDRVKADQIAAMRRPASL